ncbi:MAG TPA: phosphotransferase family protein [Anaeromyxobacteraceae bacterium]|nr:phosphotransferase family protein [Anaeromyxobacteraceae bacterium]
MNERHLPIDEPGEVRSGEALDVEKLAAFLRRSLDGFEEPLTVQQFGRGHSNLTYLVRAGEREAVLRRPPFGSKVKSAHDMLREFAVLRALAPLYPKVPRPLVACEDPGVIGAPFYLMDRVRGLILRGTRPPPGLELPPERMRALSTALVDGLAELHALDVRRPELAALGRPEGYVRRQVAGWTERYLRAKTDEVPEIEKAATWLASRLPPERGAALVHNDYKYDNLVLDPADPSRIVAVLDWEMATVGDPLMDLGTTLGYWTDPEDPEEMRALPLGPTLLPGNLHRVEVAERYAARSGRPVDGLLFDYVFALCKIAVIAQQIYRRYKEGFTRDERFASLIVAVKVLGRQATRAIERGRFFDLS